MSATVKEPKSLRFVARITAADKQLFREAAAIEGRSLAKFITLHTAEAARKIVARTHQIELDAKSRRFVEALLAPPRPPTAPLKRAMARYRRHVTSV